MNTSTPLYRDLEPGIKGSDVLALQQELARLGYAAEGNGIYGQLTIRGVNQLLRHAGVTNLTGSIGPANVTWMPDTTLRAAQCPVGLNASVTDGEDLMTSGGELRAVMYSVPAKLREGKRTFSLFDISVESDQADGRVTDQTFLDELAASDGYKTTLADTSGTKPTGTLSLSQPVDAIKVPPSAVFGQQDTTACVATPAGDAIAVNIIGSALGATLIKPTAAARIDQVLIGQATDGITCPSQKAGE